MVACVKKYGMKNRNSAPSESLSIPRHRLCQIHPCQIFQKPLGTFRFLLGSAPSPAIRSRATQYYAVHRRVFLESSPNRTNRLPHSKGDTGPTKEVLRPTHIHIGAIGIRLDQGSPRHSVTPSFWSPSQQFFGQVKWAQGRLQAAVLDYSGKNQRWYGTSVDWALRDQEWLWLLWLTTSLSQFVG